MKKTVSVFLSCLTLLPLLLSCLSVTARAEETDASTLLFECDPYIMKNNLSSLEDDFNLATLDWSVKGGSASAADSLSLPPYSVYEGSRSLLIKNDSYTAGSTITVQKSSKQIKSALTGDSFALAVYLPSFIEEARLELSVKTKGGSYSGGASLKAGRWQSVFFDLSGKGLSGKISSITVSFSCQSEGEIYFLLDTCGFTSKASAVSALKYMTTEFSSSGATVTKTDNSALITLSGREQYIEVASPQITDFSGGRGIRVTLKNSSSCRELTLYYTTVGQSEYSKTFSVSKSISGGEGVQSLVFPIPDSYIGKFKLAFEGDCYGDIELLSLTPALCFSVPISSGEIKGCLIGKDKSTISVTGSFAPGDETKYAGCRIYLYELDLGDDISSLSASSTSVAQGSVGGRDFSLSLPLSASRNELYKKYLAAVYYQGALIPIGSPVSVTNPEALSQELPPFSTSSKKGSAVISGTPVLDGITHTYEKIYLDRLIDLGVTDVLTHEVCGIVCTFNRAYVEELDQKMRRYGECGIAVSFVLCLDNTDDISLRALLCHESASGGNYSAIDCESKDGAGAVRAVCDFLAKRYSLPAGVSNNAEGFVLGTGINDAASNYNMGKATLSELVSSYASLFRTVYASVKSVNRNLSVYISLGGDWYSADLTSKHSSFDASTTLSAFADCMSLGGDIDWRVCYDVYGDSMIYPWESEARLGYDADRITSSNLEVLVEYMSSDSLLFNGSQRKLLLLEFEKKDEGDTNTYIKNSAEFVYLYLKLSQRRFDSVIALIPAHSVNYNSTLKYIDTNYFSEISEYAKEIMGEQIYQKLVASASRGDERYLSEKGISTIIPSAVKGELQLFDLSSGTDGWIGVLGCSDVAGGIALDGLKNLISARLLPAQAKDYRGIGCRFEQSVDLSAAQYIGFNIRTTALHSGAEELEVLVVLSSGNDLFASKGNIAASSWSNVVIDLSSFSGATHCDGISIYIRGKDGAELGEPTMLVGNIRAMSSTYSDKELNTAIRPAYSKDMREEISLQRVITVAVILLCSLGIAIGRVIIRHRAFGKDEEEYIR